ncbi:proteasomal ubiquitin receptor ADRM1 [Strongylocentrotus purpuratus]|uniref:Proteasomal ubiquitin receptor ADRM1 n=1 Tax=Strongylocentrotus purpuratus TaxID=7668 RepID=A0A7M7N3S6_STRPU|nr:proteasomal ubiquitin receptor ADRM1 [Strongylocentrotus purpuratus]
MSGALFGSSATGGRPSSKNLVEFRAGKMELKGTTVTSDKRKGLVYLHQPDDTLMHFCWKDRTSGTVVDDLIIFPDDCEFKRVPQCTTGRVYILKFKSSARKFFFWMQEPKTDKDDELCKKVNDVLNNPPAPGSSGLGGGRGTGGLPADLGGLGSALGEGGLQSMLGNMDQQQMMQLLSGGGLGGLSPLGLQSMLGGARTGGASESTPSRTQSSARPATSSSSSVTPATTQSSTPAARPSTTPAAVTPAAAAATPTSTASSAAAAAPGASPAAGQPAIQLRDLQSILSSMNLPGEAGAGQPAVDLSQLMTSDAMTPILANQEIQKKLIPFLPEGESLPKDPEQLRATLQSPQFQQALGMFTAAFQSGQLGPLMAQFGLSSEATDAANSGDIESFSRALQGGSSSKDDKKDDKKDGDDEAMNVD